MYCLFLLLCVFCIVCIDLCIFYFYNVYCLFLLLCVLCAGANSDTIADGYLGIDNADDVTLVITGTNGVAAANVHHGEVVAAARVASPSTPGTNSEAIADGCLRVVVAGNGRV